MKKNKLKNFKCYCCNEIATTTEHTPPQCFYPTQLELPIGSPNYRTNLIEVPSCSKHNNDRSKDDQYTAAVIIMNAKESEEIAWPYFISKWADTLLRSNASLWKRIKSRSSPVIAVEKKGSLVIPYETLAIRYERDRIDNVIRSTALALYYHESKFQDKWLGDCIIKSPNFLKRDLSRGEEHEYLEILDKLYFSGEQEQKGPHPDIFYYQICQTRENGYAIKMVFYGCFIFFALFRPKSSQSGQGFQK